MTRVFLTYLLFFSLPLWAIDITLLNTHHKTSAFGQLVSSFAQDAAEDLDIKFTVIYSDSHHIVQLNNINKLTQMNKKPDYVIFTPYRDSIVQVFNALEKAKIPFVTLERVYTKQEVNTVGLPQEKYKYWLGEMFPDNVNAGEILSSVLVNTLIKGKPNTTQYQAIVLTGDNYLATLMRWHGLKKLIGSIPQIKLVQRIDANWHRGEANSKYNFLLKKHKKIDLIFASSDEMALGVVDALQKSDLTVNEDIVIGGFDWIPEALIAINQGKLTASAGGHFMQGAWAMVKIYDYHHGLNVFKKGDDSVHIEMLVADKSNIDTYLPLAKKIDFTKINFARYSLAHQDNPHPEQGYQFSLKEFMDSYNRPKKF
ncbi:MAG: ABC-type sugar transport system substrate-binding protein [Alteromonadaceae bacterium]|jgi:ABC-type sugar transport system substrate-binding protein